MKIDEPILRAILIPYAGITVVVVVFLTTYWYLNAIPASDLNTANIAILTASSILFGFATQSFARFSDKITDLKRRISDLGKELCVLYETIKNDEKLSCDELIFYEENKGIFESIGLDSYGGKPLQVIEAAYRTVIEVFMFNLKMLYRKLIIGLQAVPVGLLFGSILASLFAFSPSFTRVALEVALTLLLLAICFIPLGWYYSSRWLNRYDDSMFNIRQQITGELSGIILPSSYRPQKYERWKAQKGKDTVEQGGFSEREIFDDN